MALYSWFTRDDKKPSVKKVSVNSDLLKAANTAKYIENYTMWPTARIKENVEITPPNFSEKSPKLQKVILPTNTALVVIKTN